MKTGFISLLFSCLATLCIAQQEVSESLMVLYHPPVTQEVFRNPMKGFRASSIGHELYPSLIRFCIPWNKLERSENDGIERFKLFADSAWKDLPIRNQKAIVRVFLEWPYGSQDAGFTRDTVANEWGHVQYVQRCWPTDMTKGDYSSPHFRKRLQRFIALMGEAWDADPRVACIEMGLIGWWGEQHSPSISPEMQELMGEAFTKAFPNTHVLVRNARDFRSFRFGSYWDSYAHINQEQEAVALLARGDEWKYTIRGGETAYDWGEYAKQPGPNPDESLRNPVHLDYILDHVRSLHTGHLGWINLYNQNDSIVAAGAAQLQKALGYRFVLQEVQYNPETGDNRLLRVMFSVINEGSASFPYTWPLEVSLLEPMSREVIWNATYSATDIMQWLPGDQWDNDANVYRLAPVAYSTDQTFTIPSRLPQGDYILALSVLDPAGNKPALRFANANYFKGGRHPIGIVHVGRGKQRLQIQDLQFDSLTNDWSLFYNP